MFKLGRSIPFPRVHDFLRGESSNKECPTRFHVQARRRRQPKTPYKPKVDGILEYILYWCSFGPDDQRKGGLVRPSKINVSKKKNAGRPNTKRGCTCHFIVKRLIAEPSVALIIYNQDKHVHRKGGPCHGPQDKMAAGTRAMFAPCISEGLLLRVQSLLYVYFTFVGGNLVTWRSKKQNVVARSSVEAEFRGMALGICEILWLKSLLQDLGVKHGQPMKLFCDNKVARDIAHNPVQHDRTKHVEVDRFFIKEKLESKVIEVHSIGIEDQVADILTKAVSSDKFSRFLDKLGMCNIYAPT